MIIPKLALRNLLGAGLRTWLNVVVLSFAYVAIIWMQGLYEGMNRQVSRAMIDAEYGGGQYQQEKYDPYDPLSLQDAHAKIPPALNTLIALEQATPILIVQGTVYPNGRIRPVLLKGIDPEQKILSIPAEILRGAGSEVPALIGARMAKSSGLAKGDYVTIRWRDRYGTFDAIDVRIARIMRTVDQGIDVNQIWLPLQKIWTMAAMPGEATIIVLAKDAAPVGDVPGWQFKSTKELLSDIRQLVKSKTVGASFLYVLLLFLAMLAIFDTQVLSIFRRRKEIGTLMALGMTRSKVIQLFTLEGAMHAILAALVAAVYGIPLFTVTAKHGWALPQSYDSYGFALGEKLFPSYSAGLIVGTTLLVLLMTTIVSYLPTRKIAGLKPPDALRGKWT